MGGEIAFIDEGIRSSYLIAFDGAAQTPLLPDGEGLATEPGKTVDRPRSHSKGDAARQRCTEERPLTAVQGRG